MGSVDSSGSVTIERFHLWQWRVLEQLFLEIFPGDFSERSINWFLRAHAPDLFVAKVGDKICGFYVFDINGDPSVAWLLYLGVVPSQRGRGLGKALLEHFEQTVLMRDFRGAGLSVMRENEPARQMYEKSGYHLIAVPPDRFHFLKVINENPRRSQGRCAAVAWTNPVRHFGRKLIIGTLSLWS